MYVFISKRHPEFRGTVVTVGLTREDVETLASDQGQYLLVLGPRLRFRRLALAVMYREDNAAMKAHAAAFSAPKAKWHYRTAKRYDS